MRLDSDREKLESEEGLHESTLAASTLEFEPPKGQRDESQKRDENYRDQLKSLIKQIKNELCLIEKEPQSDNPQQALEAKQEKERELELLKQELKKFGRKKSRKKERDRNSPQEKTRINVTKSITYALGKIHKKLPYMKQYLNKSAIKTGDHLSYTSVPGVPARWQL